MQHRPVAALGLYLFVAGTALAQPVAPVPKPLELRFDISRYVVEGNTLLPQSEVEALVGPFAGKQRDFSDVQRALEALEAAYRTRGYSAVQVYLPEQDLERGDVRLRVIEAKIRKLEVTGNRFFDEANVRAGLVSLAPGATPNANVVAKNLRILNENPAKQTSVTLRAGERAGDVDALVEVTDESPKKVFVTLDNTGSAATGYYRLGVGYQDANLGNRDVAMTLQYVTSPDHLKDVSIYSAGVHVPLYARGASMDFFAGYSDVDAGTTTTPAGPLSFSGRGGVLGARYNWHLDRVVGYDHKLVFGIDHRMYRNACSLGTFGAAGCGTAAATFSLTPVSVTYAGSWTLQAGIVSLYATAQANLAGGSRGNTEAIGRARANAKASYKVYRGGASLVQSLTGDWQVRARIDLQHADEELTAPEQFGIGGANSVRGFLERERADDRGHSASAELYTPDLSPRFGWSGWQLRALAFYDFGRTSRVNALPGEQVHNGIASGGIGLRLTKQKAFALRFDLAQIVDPGGTRERNHYRFSFAAIWSF